MKLPNLKSVKTLDKDELLGFLGLQTKHSLSGQLMSTLGTFGIGLLVGAGVALLLAPNPGRHLRAQLRSKLRRSEPRLGVIADQPGDPADGLSSRV